ncbi:hypothetical protein [Ancrocorticia populi]|uniref:hypothetical protein n=1 Tax=Ancrocorticia populi TaxID=2175228 RepID=UPI002352DF84|nr:hypothetical protein [Ancrocorticia populi]
MSILTRFVIPIFIGMQLIVYWILQAAGMSGYLTRHFLAGLIAFVILVGVTTYLARAEGTLDPTAEDAGTHRLTRFLYVYLFPLMIIAMNGLNLLWVAAGKQALFLLDMVIVLAIGLPISIKLRKKLHQVS